MPPIDMTTNCALLICRLGASAVRVLSCTCRSLHRSIAFDERCVATRPLTQLVVYDGPIVIDEPIIDEPTVEPSFSCQHQPCCADRQAHVQLIRVNAARRRAAWREKQKMPTLPPPPPPPPPAPHTHTPRSSSVGRGTRMPAARQVCCVHSARTCDVACTASRLSGGGTHVAKGYQETLDMESSVGCPDGQEKATPQSRQQISRMRTRGTLGENKWHVQHTRFFFIRYPPPLPVAPG